MFNNLTGIIARHIFNIQGWRTKRKIIVIESDDWGSIRMPSKGVYENFLKEGYKVNLNPYERYDSLASKEDLEFLFDLLYSFKDKNGNHPVITANCVVANPDFEKIKADNFNNYHFELITDTFKSYPEHTNNFKLWIKGNESGVFHPQFHAREHLNVSKFMRALKQNDSDIHFAFNNRMPGSIKKDDSKNANYFVEATHFDSEKDKNEKLKIYIEGLQIFEKLFGYKSMSIIPPNYIWSSDFNESVAIEGVKYIQGIRKMREPHPSHTTKYHSRYLGTKDNQGLINLIRNCTFEPTLYPNTDSVNKCLSDITVAFRMMKPAVIKSHRLNFIGYIDKTNRDKNLNFLITLLKNIKSKWPDVEFISSDTLGKIITESKSHK